MELTNGAYLNIFNKNNDRITIGLSRFICRKKLVEGKIGLPSQDHIKDFELYQRSEDWALPAKYSSNARFLV